MYKIKQLQTKIKILISLISLVASKIECAGRQLSPNWEWETQNPSSNGSRSPFPKLISGIELEKYLEISELKRSGS